MTLFDLKTFHFEINIYFVFSFQIMVFRKCQKIQDDLKNDHFIIKMF